MPRIRPSKGLTFDDVLLEPRKSSVDRNAVSLATHLTKTVILDIPILSAAMDTVSEGKMAIALGKLGGLAVLHRNCEISDQVAWIKKAGNMGVQVGAAVGPHDIERAQALSGAGVTAIFVDCAHAHHTKIIKDLRAMKKTIHKPLVIGNIATKEAALELAPFADALKVGIGPGAICTTRVVTGVGVPQLTAIMDVVSVAKKKKIPVIADGGIKYSGDIVKALAAGASAVMLGSMLAGTDESPGKVVAQKGKKMKMYRGMGSLTAMKRGASSDRYFQKGNVKYVPEGVEGLTPYKGSVAEVVWNMVGGLKSGMGYIGAKKIEHMPAQARFIQLTQASFVESHPHSLVTRKDAPNYR
ncbi:MAG: guanosine monophosphate reductase [Candidatus Kerfeldbacteria bacterium CG08_land_8_20_14_0_20_42_7]|uniref:Guanosine monophosphate reductase n=1 Tax=Candidatus Kerfeldbacteria bacterium CG08_land_8_20_14_0_20_42_7 TaxID=2014245 RepID=A0A2H0YTL2_9BACT|nr:MAG: guanosine monophosphate reductase [Candidatus Kerfeldbacteria bacterium CG08_land_8_20_14_0_20_42_7]